MSSTCHGREKIHHPLSTTGSRWAHTALAIASLKGLQRSEAQLQADPPNGCFSENNGTPKSSIFLWFSIINPSILGYPYFWKHPNLQLAISSTSWQFLRLDKTSCKIPMEVSTLLAPPKHRVVAPSNVGPRTRSWRNEISGEDSNRTISSTHEDKHETQKWRFGR